VKRVDVAIVDVGVVINAHIRLRKAQRAKKHLLLIAHANVAVVVIINTNAAAAAFAAFVVGDDDLAALRLKKMKMNKRSNKVMKSRVLFIKVYGEKKMKLSE
jgi:hypothetical protein